MVRVNLEACLASSPRGPFAVPHLASISCLSLYSTWASYMEPGKLSTEGTTIKSNLLYEEGLILPCFPVVMQHITLAINALSSMLEAAGAFCSSVPPPAHRHAWEHIAHVEQDKLLSLYTVPGPLLAV